MNCGACGRACKAGESCQQGECVGPTQVCAPACAPGQNCINNACVCPAATTLCANACVDVATTPAHCGACGNACGAGKLCQAGACVCPPGQVDCAGQCVDPQLSPQHCGMCGNACDADEACMAGRCRAPAGADGCTGEPTDLLIQEVAAFQSTKVSLSNGVTLVNAEQRTAIIQNRPTLFRVYVRPGTGFMPREFSARVTVINGMDEDQYFAKQQVTKASTDADSASTFQIDIPREKIAADTRFSVELVECAPGPVGPDMGAAPAAGSAAPAAGSGMAAADSGTSAAAGSGAGAAGRGGASAAGRGGTAAGGRGGTMMPAGMPGTRLPADGDAPLDAIDTGTLKIRIIPLVVGGRMPDVSEAGLKIYKEYMEAMYPVDTVEMKVGMPLMAASPVNWGRTLEQLRARRQSEMVPADEYYYGLLRPTERFQEFCRGGCTAGVAYIGNVRQTATRVGMGLAYNDEMSAGIMAHEVGHTHGRPHAPCAPGNQIQSVDQQFPYQRGGTGVWSYDHRTKKFYDPMTTKDIMGYCEPKWISDYNYELLFDRSTMINKLEVADPTLMQSWRVLYLDSDGPQWSVPFPRPDMPFGTPEDADVLDADNQPIDRVTVYRTEIGDHTGFTVLVPEPQQGWNSIKLHDALPLPFSAPVVIPAP